MKNSGENAKRLFCEGLVEGNTGKLVRVPNLPAPFIPLMYAEAKTLSRLRLLFLFTLVVSNNLYLLYLAGYLAIFLPKLYALT